MRRIKPIMFSSMAMATALLVSACNTTGQSTMTADWSSVVGKEWQLTILTDGNKTLTPTAPIKASANFTEDGKVNGISGCNNYFGTYSQDAGKLTFSPLGATRKMCFGDAMDIENTFNSATTLVTAWQLDGGNLVLNDASGKPVMTFTSPAP
ncbi:MULTISPECIES: META domain-containing protein [Thalassospira]|uniref:META domain-containing protein n=1 Tax=Thalassospira aquimaris TaxID=3037796 RepID=A0ABT6GFS1_9PROT|nr:MULTISPECIES: META domain-containing protein [Thalassospira]MDG4720692.1 META domain-containing protein [Thalassospira sp. FZY0004]